MLENHISLMHGIKNPDLSQMAKAKAAERDPAEAKSPKRPARVEQGEAESGAGPEAPAAKRLKGRWRCAKCGFATALGTEFRQHIPQHRADSSSAQCPLCGLCYTSHSSLGRHLFIVHKVKEDEEEEEARLKLQGERSTNGHEGHNGEMQAAAGGKPQCQECSRDSALCGHAQTCGTEGPHSTSQNNHSKALQT
ncbi:ZN592 protein, partial [Ramphastos sulfuratus]|nr:ZN592 protein [Ramphastos sulfuratus]